MLAPTGAIPLLIDIVKTQLKASTSIAVLQSPEQFAEAVKARVADWVPAEAEYREPGL